MSTTTNEGESMTLLLCHLWRCKEAAEGLGFVLDINIQWEASSTDVDTEGNGIVKLFGPEKVVNDAAKMLGIKT